MNHIPDFVGETNQAIDGSLQVRADHELMRIQVNNSSQLISNACHVQALLF